MQGEAQIAMPSGIFRVLLDELTVNAFSLFEASFAHGLAGLHRNVRDILSSHYRDGDEDGEEGLSHTEEA